MEEGPDIGETTSTDELNELLRKLKFSEEESAQVKCITNGKNAQGFDSLAVGKIMANEHPNREAMYRVFRSLWYTKEEVDFVALKEGAVIVKFGCLEDRSRILNLMPWLFDKCLFSMVPFVKGKNIADYEFWLSPFWLRVYNIPIEFMDRQLALDVGNAIGALMAIDWKDRKGAWTEFKRLKVKIDISKPLRRVVKFVSDAGEEMIGVIKYERLPDFCYLCGLIGHTTRRCQNNRAGDVIEDSNLQYGSWMRVPFVNPTQDRNRRRNGVEIVKENTNTTEDKKESQTNSKDESGHSGLKSNEKEGEEASITTSPVEQRINKPIRDSMGRFKHKRKRMRMLNGNSFEESPYKNVKRGLMESVSPVQAMAGLVKASVEDRVVGSAVSGGSFLAFPSFRGLAG
ncbi:hypothetical protein PVK06_030149 [Gossypium arboreum]|uniref:CCHC-type domain-containing protein n=1 Tax=Gossypium arboreum TaxID=29729 RepID=A0ABR0NMI4_GOSAR|nr:hypothetical protein PVK06_030149 [Gossypium arboreum]